MHKLIIPIALGLSALSAQPRAATVVDLTHFSVVTGTNSAASLNSSMASISGTATLTGNVLQLTSFQWLFSTTDSLPFNDYSYFIATGAGTVRLADIASLGFTTSTGWQTYLLATPYSGKIIFGVANDFDDESPSTLKVRNLVSAIPEPETYAMLLAGLGLMGFVVRRRTGRRRFATT